MTEGDFSDGEGSSHDDLIIRQKIRLKEISFFAYLFALVASFTLGMYAIILMITEQLSWDHFLKAVQIAAGTALTIGLRNLYRRTSEELQQLGR